MSIDPVPFNAWLSFLQWGGTVTVLVLFSLLLCTLVTLLTSGLKGVLSGLVLFLGPVIPTTIAVFAVGDTVAFYTMGVSFVLSLVASVILCPSAYMKVLTGIGGGFWDLLGTSFRRVGALTTLTTKESLRRKTLLVMAVFGVFFLFGSWFLPSSTVDSDLQVKNYVSFVLTTVSWLILPAVFLLSCWGLPDDIKARSLHTVVTKPVRRSEVLLGRVFGVSVVGTILLAIMGGVGYVWLVRALPTAETQRPIGALTRNQLATLNTVSEAFRKIDSEPAEEAEAEDAEGEGAEGDAGEETKVEFTPERILSRLTPSLQEGLRDGRLVPFVAREVQDMLNRLNPAQLIRIRKGENVARVSPQLRQLISSLPNEQFEVLRSARAIVSGELQTLLERLPTDELRQLLEIKDEPLLWRDLDRNYEAHVSQAGEGELDEGARPIRFVERQEKVRLIARVPVHGDISFLDRKGAEANAGVNTGDVWAFRSYIEGNTKARAIWEFTDVTPRRFGDSLKLESSFQVFRTYKGDLETGILCQYIFVNEERGIRAPYRAFPVKEFRENIHEIERNLVDDKNNPVDLFNDLAPDGKLTIEVACLTGGQFIGMARPDLFIREPDAPFASSFFKAVVGLWLMMVMLIVLGVTASCFLKGPIAMLLTLVFLIVGRLAREFLNEVTSAEWDGGGPAESVYRIITHLNPTTELPSTMLVNVIQTIDILPRISLVVLKFVIPNFDQFSLTEYTANGFDVSWNSALLPCIVTAVGYILPCLVVGYYSLKMRELESK